MTSHLHSHIFQEISAVKSNTNAHFSYEVTYVLDYKICRQNNDLTRQRNVWTTRRKQLYTSKIYFC